MPTGLDNIIKSILDDARSSRNEILSKAKIKANEILEDAKKQAEALVNSESIRIDEEVLRIKARAESLASVRLRDGLAFAKTNIINEVIKKAKEKILNLPDEDYFKFIFGICRPYFRKSEKCEIVFSSRDLKKFSKKFEDELLNLAKEVGADIKISKNTLKNNSGGVILRYQDVDENCTLDCIFSEKYSELVDLLNGILFKE